MLLNNFFIYDDKLIKLYHNLNQGFLNFFCHDPFHEIKL